MLHKFSASAVFGDTDSGRNARAHTSHSVRLRSFGGVFTLDLHAFADIENIGESKRQGLSFVGQVPQKAKEEARREAEADARTKAEAEVQACCEG